MLKVRDRRRGEGTPLSILPELCSLTGLADDVRADFLVMKDLAVHTRIGPADHVKRLQKFISDITSKPESIQEMRNWNVQFAPNLLTTNAHHLQPEMLYQTSDRRNGYSYQNDNADWSWDMRGQPLLSAVSLTSWKMMCSQHDQKSATELYSTL